MKRQRPTDEKPAIKRRLRSQPPQPPSDDATPSSTPPPILTPHTLRLLKLVQEGSRDHSALAASQLTTITAQSSSVVMWEVLGRLLGLLSASEWRTRANASAAMQGVARHLPVANQRDFLQQPLPSGSKNKVGQVSSNNDDDNNNQQSVEDGDEKEHEDFLWLRLEDLTAENNAGLFAILKQGRLLLARGDDDDNDPSSNFHAQEEQMLQRLDQQQLSQRQGDVANDDDTNDFEINSTTEFVQQRIHLQRRILAQRLGLAGVLQATRTTPDSMLSGTIFQEDFLPPPERPSSMPRKKRKRKNDGNKNEKEENPSSTTIRALLVIEMKRHQDHQEDAFSHHNPQTLLATELLYRMLDPSWQVRHGAILGILSLLRAWNNSAILAFGAWPDDLLARCLCLLVLDRFGDYSGTMISSCSSFTDVVSNSGGVVAPIRETAAQLSSVLVRMAPPTKQHETIRLLIQLAKPEFFANSSNSAGADEDVDDTDYWEIRHGALLALKYIVVVTVSRQTMPTAFSNDLHEDECSQVLMGSLTEIANVAIQCLSDVSDDVQSVAAHILKQLMTNKISENNQQPTHRLRFDQEALSHRIFHPMWKALESARSVSSCTVDLLSLCTALLRVSSSVIVRERGPLSSPPQSQDLGSRVLDKMREFLDHDLRSVRISAIQSIAVVVESIVSSREGCDSPEGQTTNANAQHEPYGGCGTQMASAMAKVAERLFDSFFDVSRTSSDTSDWKNNNFINMDTSVDDEYFSSRNVAWDKLIVAIKRIASENEAFSVTIHSLKKSLIFRYFGLVISTGATASEVLRLYPLEGGASSLRSVRNDDLFESHLAASRALAKFLTGADSQNGSGQGDGHPSLILTGDLVELSIGSFVHSPWPEQCEAACLLFRALSALCSCNSTVSNYCTSFCGALRTCRQSLCALLTSQNDFPLSLLLVPAEEAHNVLKDPGVIRLCDNTFAGAVHLVAQHGRSQGKSQSAAADVIEMYKRTIGARFDITTTNHRGVNSTVAAMRVFATMAGAVISTNRVHNCVSLENLLLNKKISPFVRPIMTSLKNETQKCRQAETCAYLVDLLESMQAELVKDSPFARAKSKILGNLCEVVASGCPQGPGSTQEYFAFAQVLQSLIGKLQHRNSSFQCIEPLWKAMNHLVCSDFNALVGTSSQQVSKALNLLKAASGDLRREKPLTDNTIETFVPPIVHLACREVEDLKYSSFDIIKSFARIDPQKMLSVALPALLPLLEDHQNDHQRLTSCQLLQMMMEEVGVDICPFVRHLLRVVMSLMADFVQDCSRIANSMFGTLVRAAPLVRPNEFISPNVPNKKAADKSFGKDADGVVDHLIHGKPLPPYVLPRVIKDALKRSGVILRPYQMDGISWLRFLQSVRLNGALCDSMGLGKTLQALIGVSISHCEIANDVHEPGPKSLVVCPASVVGHWESEIERYFPDKSIFRALAFIGSSDERKQLWERSFSSSNIVVTSYSVLRSEADTLSSTLWQFCILDEGHLLKNPKTATARASRRIRASHKLILTGTPVQNRVNELWATFDFLMPNFLGSASSFAKEFAKPITKGNLPGASAESINIGMEKLKVLHQQVLPFILRREKTQVLKELPPKCIATIPCEMSAEQRSLHDDFYNSNDAKVSLAALQDALRQGMSSHAEGTELNVGQDALKSLLFLRLLCTHPSLVEHRVRGVAESAKSCSLELSGKFQALNELLRSCGIHTDDITGADNDTSLLFCKDEGEDEDQSRSDSSDLLESADNILSSNDMSSTNDGTGDSKCLLFAQFTQSLDAVEELLLKPHMPSLRYVRLDGRVPANKRTAIVDKFNRDPTVKLMLLTTRVGSLGLNLQTADTVVFLENDYNPFVDLQAMDRAHRIGQERTVFVYRLVTKDSIEEKIMKLQERKMAMSKAIVNSENSTMFSMGTDKLLDIFTCRSDSHTQLSGQQKRSNKQVSSAAKRDFDLDALLERYKDDYKSLSVSDFIESFHK